MHGILIFMLALATDSGDSPVDFDTQVIPVLTKAGCNSGACHGAAAGRGEFRLSLYGSNPDLDYRSIVHELEGRRVHLSRPDESLLLLKATESINHGGGPRLELDGAGANLLRQWIDEGALRNRAETLEHFSVQPRSYVASGPGETVDLKATARFSNGADRDVTSWTVFTADDPAAVELDSETATATVLRRGRHIVVARFLDHVVPIEIVAPLSGEPVDLSKELRRNFIDDHILKTLEILRLPVSPSTDDSAFLRRVTLDLTGRLPSPVARTGFLNDQSPQKREQLIDRLLASDEFTEYWTLQFAKLLRIRSQPGDSQGTRTYHSWLRSRIADRTPYDQIVRELLTASGDTHQVGPASFYRTVGGAREQAEFISELFMGTRLRCANCHNHPLDHWTQDDYHGLAAIFAKINRGRVITLSARGEVTHPRTGEAAVPRIPGDRFLTETNDGRVDIAEWLTDPTNSYFAKATVNRLWKALIGRGLVEPTDDLRSTNPATHPPLLKQLAADFVEHSYDLRHTLRLIATSQTYARSALPLPDSQTDDRYYSHALTRPLEPEVLADAIADVTGIFDQYEGFPPDTRAVSLIDPSTRSETLDVLGRCSREESCETSAESATDGLTLKLHLLNGELLNRRITHPNGRLTKYLATKTSSLVVIHEFYRLALGREPSETELRFWQQQLEEVASPQRERELLEDFLWSLLTCREFVTNH